jgi:NTP pyrophosphatase (non-canonical NTP hydrolase)
MLARSIHNMTKSHPASVGLDDFQRLIRKMYYKKDEARGVDGTFMWLMEEVGELAAALREGSHQDKMEEFADVLAWLATIANVAGVDLAEAVTNKYGAGCPGCNQLVCQCPNEAKP